MHRIHELCIEYEESLLAIQWNLPSYESYCLNLCLWRFQDWIQLSHAEPSRPSPWAHESAPDVSAIHMGRWFKHFKSKSWRSGIWAWMQHGCMFLETLVIIGKKSSLERKEGNVSNMFFRLDCFIVSWLFHDCFMTVSFFFMCHDVSWCVMMCHDV